MVVLTLLASQTVICDVLGRAIGDTLMEATLNEYKEEGTISDVEHLVDTLKTITDRNKNYCVLYKGKKCLLVLKSAELDTTTLRTKTRPPRHTESFTAATEAKTFLKDKLITLVQKSYPTIKKMVEGFYANEPTSLLAANSSDQKLWSKRLSASVDMITVRML